MKEDILKFRKLCDILIEENSYSVNKIVIESGITWPTMKKLREDDINNIHIMSSVLGQVQNYLHKHCDTIRLAGIIANPAEESFMDKAEAVNKQQLLKGQTDFILAGERNLGPVTESEKASLAGTKIHEKIEKEIEHGSYAMLEAAMKAKNSPYPLSIKKTRKYIKKDKGNVIKAADINSSDIHEEAHEDTSGMSKEFTQEAGRHIRSGKHTIPDYVFKEKKDPDIIGPRNLTQIIIFLKTEAAKYRDLARDFDICANELLKTNLK